MVFASNQFSIFNGELVQLEGIRHVRTLQVLKEEVQI